MFNDSVVAWRAGGSKEKKRGLPNQYGYERHSGADGVGSHSGCLSAQKRCYLLQCLMNNSFWQRTDEFF
jgi:hypothetical protein